jgi:hypothetical protein
VPSHQPLIADFRGNVIIEMAVGSLAIGFGTIRRMMRSVTNSDGVRGRIMNLSASDHVGLGGILILLLPWL